jgi:hypothetical protein
MFGAPVAVEASTRRDEIARTACYVRAVIGNPSRWAIAIGLAISAGCAPPIDGPIDHQRARDRDDGDRLAAQLALLPGVVAARVVLHHAARDPLAVAPPTRATFTAVIAVDDRAATEAIRAATDRLARAAIPELAGAGPLAIEVHPTVRRPVIARVGPFLVEASSRTALRVTLALACVAIFGLAAALAVGARRHRLGNSAQ